jgi:hypothetical protein
MDGAGHIQYSKSEAYVYAQQSMHVYAQQSMHVYARSTVALRVYYNVHHVHLQRLLVPLARPQSQLLPQAQTDPFSALAVLRLTTQVQGRLLCGQEARQGGDEVRVVSAAKEEAYKSAAAQLLYIVFSGIYIYV